MYGVEFQTQSDLNGGTLCDTLVSIPSEMSQHLGLLHIMCYLIEVPLEPLFQTVLGLANILLLTSCAGYTVHQIVTVAADGLCSVHLSGD